MSHTDQWHAVAWKLQEGTGTGLVACDARDGRSCCITGNSCSCKSETDNLRD